MADIKLLEGIFKQSQEKGKEYLLYLDVDRLIAPCYEAANQQAKKERYGGWEKTPIAGHSIGHWLSAAAQMYYVTGDRQLLEKLKYALAELENVQDSDGYLSGFPRTCFDQVFTGEFDVEHFSLAGSWVPWYSIHKIYAGLIDIYQLIGEQKALQIVIKMADWAYNGLKDLTHNQFQKMLICEHGGMNDSFADLYIITKDERYLELAEKFYHEAILEPLADGTDDLEGKHANTQIPKVIGAAKLYNITGKEKYKRVSTFFWDQVVQYRTYAIGGNSIREHFGPENAEELGILTTETCNSYNMLKLTEVIFSWSQEGKYYDFYERALYNHILASQDPESGMKTYFVSSEPGHFKVYNSKDHSFWCCTGTGMENPARYNRGIFYHQANQIFINLFISAKYETKDVIIKQETGFPQKDVTIVTLEKIDENDSLLIRKPYWLAGDIIVEHNGKNIDYMELNGYIKLEGKWQNGDKLNVTTPMNLHKYIAKDDEKKQVIMYGPIVLAGALGRENYPDTDILADHQELNNYPLIEVPTIVTNVDQLEQWIHLQDAEKLIFETVKVGQPGNQKLQLKPFYDIHHERYTIYWNIMDGRSYEHFVDAEKELRDRIQKVTVDVVTPHEQQPEVDHNMKAEKSTSGYLNIVHSGYRDARDGGYFSYEMKVDKTKDMYVSVTYFGGDMPMHVNGKWMERDFSIWINDEKIGEQILNNNKPGQLFTVSYQIPKYLFTEKETVRVKFQADEGKIAGGVYEVRMLNESKI
ncbi:beta-L-arabinofuranosidase domain-containing protein [Gracilibacillus xinjiangensis]|uniref:Beta-L-arabinofuranosidase domain-containing protein n=1 Tax=Gracilibacillus xinjiangensis TaxID=1193282 RepID=A0ABV8WUE3_9BACI